MYIWMMLTSSLNRCLWTVVFEPLSLQHLLTLNPNWHPPQLFSLPRQYEHIFQQYRKETCKDCGKCPREPALCLVCSRLVCFKEKCCVQKSDDRDVHECIRVSGMASLMMNKFRVSKPFYHDYRDMKIDFVVETLTPNAIVSAQNHAQNHYTKDHEIPCYSRLGRFIWG